MPNDGWVHGHDALCDQIADHYSLIRITRRQTGNLRVRWVGIESTRCFKWIVDDAQRVQLCGYVVYDRANIHFSKTSVWPQAKTEQAAYFVQLMDLVRRKCLEPIHGQSCFFRSCGA